MAQLKNLIVNGASRFIGDIYASQAQLTTLIAPSSTNSTIYSAGADGQFVKSNGNSIYWTNLEANDITEGAISIAHGGTGATTELNARQNLDIPQEDMLSYRFGESGKHYIKTALTCGSSNFFIGFKIIVESSYTTKKPSIIIGSGYWNYASNTFTNAVYYDATKNLNGIELIAADDNTLFIALDPPSTYQRYSVFVYYSVNRNRNYAIERVDTAPTATITVAMTRIASYDATRLSSEGTTAQFWRGDNKWSNELSGGLLKITNNSNTVTIGSANANYMHFSNSADIPFYFNKSLWVDGDLYPYGTSNTSSLGSSSKRWKSLLIGTADSYGGVARPIYWKDGVPTALNETVGATDKPVFLSSGTITESTSNIGSGIIPIYMASGQIKASTSTIGSNEKPVYLNAGTITAGLPVWTLTNPTQFAENESFNDKTTIGNYYISANSVANTIPDDGKPGTGNIYGTLKVSKMFTGTTNPNYLRQDWFAHSSAKYFTRRTGSTGNWSGWSAYAYIPPDATTKKPVAVGSTSQPVYIKNDGEITALDYTIEKSVPSNATFTDTKVNFTLNTSSKAYLMACTSAPTSTTTAREAIGDTSVYISNHTLYATSIDTNSLNINDVANISSLGNMSIANLEVSSTSLGTTSKHYGHIDTGTLQLISEEDDRYIFIEPPSSSAVALNAFLRADGNWSNVIETSNKLKTTSATNATKMFILGQSTAGTGQDTYIATANTSGSANKTGIYFQGSTGVLMGAAWNDYAEFRQLKENKMYATTVEPGRVVYENGDDTLSISSERLMRGCSIVSDTYGFGIGESEEAQLPIAVSGRVLAYPYENREKFKQHIGWPVCSGPNGTVSIMTEEEEEKYPSRIIGIISAIPDYEIWHGGTDVNVNGRVWIKVR